MHPIPATVGSRRAADSFGPEGLCRPVGLLGPPVPVVPSVTGAPTPAVSPVPDVPTPSAEGCPPPGVLAPGGSPDEAAWPPPARTPAGTSARFPARLAYDASLITACMNDPAAAVLRAPAHPAGTTADGPLRARLGGDGRTPPRATADPVRTRRPHRRPRVLTGPGPRPTRSVTAVPAAGCDHADEPDPPGAHMALRVRVRVHRHLR